MILCKINSLHLMILDMVRIIDLHRNFLFSKSSTIAMSTSVLPLNSTSTSLTETVMDETTQVCTQIMLYKKKKIILG